jgi:hypothetical protein
MPAEMRQARAVVLRQWGGGGWLVRLPRRSAAAIPSRHEQDSY